jgi:hypothetical protein
VTSPFGSTQNALVSAWVRHARVVTTLFVGSLAWVCGTLLWVEVTRAQSEATADPTLQREQVIRLEDVPIDQAGRPIVEGLPGVQSRREVSQAERDALKPLEEERDRVLSGAPVARRAGRTSRLPQHEGAPPPMDSGDPDPDRLRPESQPPLPTL